MTWTLVWEVINKASDFSWLWAGIIILILTILVGIVGFFIRRKYFLWNTALKLTTRINKDASNTDILFIEDGAFPIIENLKKIGYKTKKITDLIGMDDSNLITADIIFVDIRWVWRRLWLTDEWFWIVKLIREKFQSNKKIVIYSWEELRVNPAYKLADDALDKDSNLTEFKAAIDKLIENINHA